MGQAGWGGFGNEKNGRKKSQVVNILVVFSWVIDNTQDVHAGGKVVGCSA